MSRIKGRLAALESRSISPDGQSQAVRQISALIDELSAAAAGGDQVDRLTLIEILEQPAPSASGQSATQSTGTAEDISATNEVHMTEFIGDKKFSDIPDHHSDHHRE